MEIPKFDSVIQASDIHISSYNNTMASVAKFCEVVSQEKPQCLILAGDIFDRWRDTWEDIRFNVSTLDLEALTVKRADAGLTNIYIPYNHDYGVPNYILPFCTRVPKFHFTCGKVNYLSMHGWEFDILWKNLNISKVAFWIATHAPWAMIPIYKALYGSTPGIQREISVLLSDAVNEMPIEDREEVMPDVVSAMKEWSMHVEYINSRAREHAHKTKNVILFGHTHSIVPFDGLICNDGALYEDNTYIKVYPVGVKLMDL